MPPSSHRTVTVPFDIILHIIMTIDANAYDFPFILFFIIIVMLGVSHVHISISFCCLLLPIQFEMYYVMRLGCVIYHYIQYTPNSK